MKSRVFLAFLAGVSLALQGCATLAALSQADRIPLRRELPHRWDSTGSTDRMTRAVLVGRRIGDTGPSLWKFDGADIWLLWPSEGNPVRLSDSRDSLARRLPTGSDWDTSGTDTIDVYLISDTAQRVPVALLSDSMRGGIALWSLPHDSAGWQPAWALYGRPHQLRMERLEWIGRKRFNPRVVGWLVVPAGVAADVALFPWYAAAWSAAQPALLPVAGGFLALGFLVVYLMRDHHF